MQTAKAMLCLAVALAITCTTSAQDLLPDGTVERRSTDTRILLRYATFDPLVNTPAIPRELRSGANAHLWIVQFHGAPTDNDREALQKAGGVIRGYLPHDAYVVRFVGDAAAAFAALPHLRWVGAYEPAYRLEGFLLGEQQSGVQLPERRYNLVMADKRADKQALASKIEALGGAVIDHHFGGLLMTADLSGAELLAAARLDEVLWIDRWSEPGTDMDNARIQSGANLVETVGNYTGSGIRGHVYEGVEAAHPDFAVPMTNVRSSGVATAHGHCTAGIVFGDGTSAPQARGMAPAAVGFYTDFNTVTAGWSRNMVIGDVVNVHTCMFTTAAWGAAHTTAYTSVSAEADDIVFDHRIPWTQSMGNIASNNARPQAWAKNVIAVGGITHFNNSDPTDDSALAGGGSFGPAADGRFKPDLVGYNDAVWTSDLSGAAGYNAAANPAGQSFANFTSASAGTSICGGANALAIQMFTDHLFNNAPRVEGGTRFQNRPYAQTLKALMIGGAYRYTPNAPSVGDNLRHQVGWGFPSLANLWNRRDRFTVIPEDVPITQGATHTYSIQVIPGETNLEICMSYVDPAGNPAAAIDRINDLTLRVTSPGGTQYWGNNGLTGAGQFSTAGGSANTIDTVEGVLLQNPPAGIWTIAITAPTIAMDAHVATAATDATYALVVNGGTRVYGSGCARYVPDFSATGVGNGFPWGGALPSTLSTTYANNNNGSIGGSVYYNVTVSSSLYVTALDVNTNVAAGGALLLDVYRTAVGGTHIGNETNLAAWTPMSAGKGIAAGVGQPSRIYLASPFFLTPGTYGIAVVANNFAHYYTNGNGVNQNYSTTGLALAAGSASNAAFGPSAFTPRVANTTIIFRPDNAQATNMRYQTILRRGELGPAGSITGLAFAAESTGRHWNSSLLVRMSHVAAGHALVSNFNTNLPTPVTVLNQSNHSFDYVVDDWREIGLQTPFAYNGSSDVVVDIVARGNWQTTLGGFNGGDEPRVYNAIWTGAEPATGFVDNNQALRMRVSFHCAAANEFGASCGALEAGHVGDGHRNANFNFTVSNAPANLLAFLSLGLDNAAPFPISTSFLGWTNCHSWHTGELIVTVPTNAAGAGSYTLFVPNTAANDGLKIFGTWFALDSSEPGDLTFSGYTRVIVGLTP